MRVLFLLLVLSFGCATIVRGSQRPLAVLGPEDVRMLKGGVDLPIESRTKEGARTRTVALVPGNTDSVTLVSGGQQAQAELQTSTNAGFVIADYLLFVVPVLVDVMTGAWHDFGDVDTTKLKWQARTVPATP